MGVQGGVGNGSWYLTKEEIIYFNSIWISSMLPISQKYKYESMFLKQMKLTDHFVLQKNSICCILTRTTTVLNT